MLDVWGNEPGSARSRFQCVTQSQLVRHRVRPMLRTAFLVSLASCMVVSTACSSSRASEPPAEIAHVSRDSMGCAQLAQASTDPLVDVDAELHVTPLSLDELPGALDEHDMDGWAGVSIAFPAPSGWTKPWLERRVACYQETNTAKGPLSVAGADVDVLVRRGRFILRVTSPDGAVVDRIWQATAELASRRRSLTGLVTRSHGAVTQLP